MASLLDLSEEHWTYKLMWVQHVVVSNQRSALERTIIDPSPLGSFGLSPQKPRLDTDSKCFVDT